jgi:DNA polymerase bacteriophage-type
MSTLDVASEQHFHGNTEGHVLHIDFETRSRLDLKTVSTWRYASDESTEVMCACYAIDDGPVLLWTPGAPPPPMIVAAANEPGWLICAHNAKFEFLLIDRLLAPKHGWPRIPIDRFICTMSLAYASALPGSLDGVAAALGLEVRKDAAGAKVMLGIASYKIAHPTVEQYEALQRYCAQDVLVERELHKKLPPLTDAEQALWALDYKVNAKGLPIDRELALASARLAKLHRDNINDSIAALTGGKVTTTKSARPHRRVSPGRGLRPRRIDKERRQEGAGRKP